MSHLGSIRGRGEPIGPCLRDLAKSKELDDGFDFFGLLVSIRAGLRCIQLGLRNMKILHN